MYTNSFYVQCPDYYELGQILKRWTHTRSLLNVDPPAYLYHDAAQSIPFNTSTLFVFQANADWCGVDHLMEGSLEVWAKRLSQHFKSKVVQLRHRASHYLSPLTKEDLEYAYVPFVKDYCYLLVYEAGQKIREIEVSSDEKGPRINFGEQFSFELPVIHAPQQLQSWSYVHAHADSPFERYDTTFGFFNEDTLIAYCEEFGFDPVDVEDDKMMLLTGRAGLRGLWQQFWNRKPTRSI